jgi:hypothetical protein
LSWPDAGEARERTGEFVDMVHVSELPGEVAVACGIERLEGGALLIKVELG